MFKRCTFFCIILTLYFYSINATAVVVPELYTAKIPVASRSEKLRSHLLSLSLTQVLIRVGGYSEIMKNPDVRKALSHAIDYVSQYRYQTIDHQESTKPLMLNILFNQVSVDRLLQSLNIPIWSSDRPLVLVWMSVRHGDKIKLLGSDSDDSILALFQQRAQLRGVPILFPILDLIDFNAISADDVWNRSIDVIVKASVRYSPNDILIVNIDESNDKQISAHWLLLTNDQQISWDTKGNDDRVVFGGADHLTGILAAQYTSTSKSVQKERVALTVNGLRNVTDYARIMNYLRRRNGVVNVEVAHVSASAALFNLTLNAGVDVLQKSIALDTLLIPVESAELNDRDVLTYEYLK